MNRLFQIAVIIWIVFHVLWALLSADSPFLEMVAFALVVTGFWMLFGVLLLRRIRFVRLLLLLAVLARIAFLWRESDLWMLDFHDFGAMARDPSTSWASNASLLLSSVLLVMAYLTPVAGEFETQKTSRKTVIGRVVAAITRSDGTMITIPTVIVLIVFVVNQFVIGAQYAENSPRAVVSNVSAYLQSVDDTGDKPEHRHAYFTLGDAYWLLNERDQAAAMYEKVVVLTPEDVDFADWELSRSVVRLMQFQISQSDARFGDGSHALALAQRLTGDARDASYFDALAAVYARLGQVEKAIQNQKIAIEKCMLTGCCENHWEYVYHLNQYMDESQSG